LRLEEGLYDKQRERDKASPDSGKATTSDPG